MYRVLKEKGNNMNITLENPETRASIIIGRNSIDILDILASAGHRIGDDSSISYRDEWNLEVDDETGKKLAEKAMTMRKPIRDQRKTSEQKKAKNKTIDAMDVLLGLASYK